MDSGEASCDVLRNTHTSQRRRLCTSCAGRPLVAAPVHRPHTRPCHRNRRSTYLIRTVVAAGTHGISGAPSIDATRKAIHLWKRPNGGAGKRACNSKGGSPKIRLEMASRGSELHEHRRQRFPAAQRSVNLRDRPADSGPKATPPRTSSKLSSSTKRLTQALRPA